MRMGSKELKWGHQSWGCLLLALCQRQDCKPLKFTFVPQTIIREMREHLANPPFVDNKQMDINESCRLILWQCPPTYSSLGLKVLV